MYENENSMQKLVFEMSSNVHVNKENSLQFVFLIHTSPSPEECMKTKDNPLLLLKNINVLWLLHEIQSDVYTLRSVKTDIWLDSFRMRWHFFDIYSLIKVKSHKRIFTRFLSHVIFFITLYSLK